MVENMITLQAKLELKTEDREAVLELMRKFSSALRYSYKRLLDGWQRKDLKKHLQGIFNLNSRYCDDAILKANTILSSVKERGQNPKKVIFGGRKLFEKLKKNHLTGKKRLKLKRLWREARQGSLYSRGDKTKNGNLNTRFVFVDDGLYLRINTGERNWVYAKVMRKVAREKDKWIDFVWRLIEAESKKEYFPYSVELKLKDGEFYAYISFEEVLPQVSITKENGVIGIDLNASPLHTTWAEVSGDGNLISYGVINLYELLNKTKEQRDYLLWQKAHEIIKIAKEKRKAIAVEKLKDIKKGQRGDGRAKLRKRLSRWVYRGLLDKIIQLAKREGIQVIQVNPAFTSVIGAFKYSPNYLIDKDIAGAYTIGRRALGFKEKLPKNYRKLLNSRRFLSYCIHRLIEKRQELNQRLKQETNIYKKTNIKHELNRLNKDLKLIESLYCEPETQNPVNQWKELVKGEPVNSYKLWQVVKVSFSVPLLGKFFIRDFSPLRPVLTTGDWERKLRKIVPAPGAGAMVEENTASWGNPLPEKAGYKYPSPDSFTQSG